jgi:hypothetical protein
MIPSDSESDIFVSSLNVVVFSLMSDLSNTLDKSPLDENALVLEELDLGRVAVKTMMITCYS